MHILCLQTMHHKKKSWITRSILISALLTFFMSTENIPMSKQNIFMSSLTTYWMSTENEPHVNKTKKENKFLWISSGNHMPARRFQPILKINIFQKYLICSQLPKKTSSTFRHILSCNCHRKAWCRCRRLPWEGESLIQERCYFFLLHQCARYFAIVCDTSPLCAIYYHKSLTLSTDWGGVTDSDGLALAGVTDT